ncbi:MAG: DNA polymerase I [Clostridiales bacterium]|nr:DNA polymerase I [Clostridiales bacterium]
MKILVIDGNSIINRAFYGIRLLSTRSGEYTNAVYGFLSTYLKVMEDEQPDGVCVAFDLKAPTFRHVEYEDYKAGRRPMPDELRSQIPLLKEVLDCMGVPRCEQPGFEADDLIGTAARVCSESGCECVILTGDRDSFQLIDEYTRVKLATTKNGSSLTIDYTPEVIREEYGISPRQLIDVKALMGDSSDNIPGVAGIGEKTALSLISAFGSLDEVYNSLDDKQIRPKVREKLISGRDSAYMSRSLGEIERYAPFCFDVSDMVLRECDDAKLHAVLSRLELRSIISRLQLSPGEKPLKRTPSLPVLPERELGLDTLSRITSSGDVCDIVFDDNLSEAAICFGNEVYNVSRLSPVWNEFIDKIISSDVKKRTSGLKESYLGLLESNIPFAGFVFDVPIASYLLDSSAESYNLEELLSKYLSITDSVETLSKQAVAVKLLSDKLRDEISKLEMTSLLEDIELPLCEVLADMQFLGFKVDAQRLSEFGTELSARTEELKDEIFDIAGEEFNINSPKQLGEVLFEKLGLPYGRKIKTGYSTDIDVLTRLSHLHPIAGKIIEYRQLTKLISTYVEGLLKVISPADGRIHSKFNQLVTTTGRISSSDPNMQNIPVRTELGSNLRRMFVPESSDYVLVDADYSQIELRILAHISGDVRMREAFISGKDIHRATAAVVAGVSPEAVTPKMRSDAKAVNFGIVYGISDFSLATDLGISRNEAKAYINEYFSRYPGVAEYMDMIKKKAKEDGYVSTLFGRRRYLPELKSTNHNTRAFGERVALNTPIQGTAADIIKIAMVSVYERLKKERLRSRLVLQVHDELIIEAHKDEAEYISRLIVEEMSKAADLSVPLVAEAGIGDDWYEAKS